LGLLSSCTGLQEFIAEHPFELNNIEADENEKRARDPELDDYLESLKVPQDSALHFSGSITRLHDRATGAPVGWEFDVRAKCAWPRFVQSEWARNASRKNQIR
jgi:hypothetical protein